MTNGSKLGNHKHKINYQIYPTILHSSYFISTIGPNHIRSNTHWTY